MIKLVYCITKKVGLTDEEFFHYWEDLSVLVFLTSADSYRAAASWSREINADPITMGWWNSGSTTGRLSLAARQSSEWRASSEDEANFIDHNKVAYFASEEHVIVGRGEAK